jgi:hypothetical protein
MREIYRALQGTEANFFISFVEFSRSKLTISSSVFDEKDASRAPATVPNAKSGSGSSAGDQQVILVRSIFLII